MKLSDYLRMHEMSLAQLAARCGTSASTMMRVRDGAVAPSKRVMEAIWEATDGTVCPNDIYGLHPRAVPERETSTDLMKERS